MALLGLCLVAYIILAFWYRERLGQVLVDKKTSKLHSPPPPQPSLPGNKQATVFDEPKPTPNIAVSPAVTVAEVSMEKDASKPSDAELMPPPPRPTPKPRTTPTTQSSLRIPSNGPLPNRLPPTRSSLSSSSSLSATSTSALAPSARPRKKVLLAPGHSPLDWADLTRSENLSGVPYPQKITPSQLRTQTGRKGKPAWSSYKGRVYNIGPYLPFHPGGEDQLMRAAGRDGEKLFDEVHSWINWENMLGSCLVGFLVPETADEGLDELD